MSVLDPLPSAATLAPVETLLSRVLRPYQPGDENRTDPPEPGRVRRLLAWLAIAERYHRYRVEGLENVPAAGPALLVSFHAFTVVDMSMESTPARTLGTKSHIA